jgi:hypothetical protein
LDKIIYQHLSDLATCHEMLVSIRLHRPQNTARMIEEVVATENREGWKRPKKEPSGTSGRVHEDVGSALIEEFFRVKPPTGSRNVAWLRRSHIIRAALEKFWASVRELIRSERASSVGVRSERYRQSS